jgi:DNA-binding PucR family transcriptional regulator
VLVVSAGPVVPGELAAAYRLCREALGAGRTRGRRGLHAVADLALAIAVDAQPMLGRLLAAGRLAPLHGDDAFHRLLAETARVYLQHGSRVEPTAAALHVHPNTVKYRIRRLSDLAVFDVATPPEEALERSLQWWWALDAWLAGKGDA